MSSIRVIIYDQPQPDAVQIARLYYQQRGQIESNLPASTHFIGKFNQPQFSRFNYNTAARDTSSSAVETNAHFIGSHKSYKFNVLPLLRQQNDCEVGAVIPTGPRVETDIWVIPYRTGQASPVIVSNLYYHGGAQDFSSSPIETNAHFLGKFTQPTFSRFNYNHGENVNSGTETNTHTIGRFTPAKFQIRPGLYNTAAFDFSSVNPAILTVEHNIQVVPYRTGQANPVLTASLYYQHADKAIVIPPSAVETNVSFLGNFTPYCFSIIPPWGTAQDNSSSAVETNAHTIGKFNAPQFNVQIALRQQLDWSSSTFVQTQPDTNPHFIGKYVPALHKVLPLLRSNIAADTGSSATETNVSFLGRFYPAQHFVLSALRQTTAQDTSSVAPQTQAVYNTMLLCIPGGMFSIPGDPPS